MSTMGSVQFCWHSTYRLRSIPLTILSYAVVFLLTGNNGPVLNWLVVRINNRSLTVCRRQLERSVYELGFGFHTALSSDRCSSRCTFHRLTVINGHSAQCHHCGRLTTLPVTFIKFISKAIIHFLFFVFLKCFLLFWKRERHKARIVDRRLRIMCVPLFYMQELHYFGQKM